MKLHFLKTSSRKVLAAIAVSLMISSAAPASTRDVVYNQAWNVSQSTGQWFTSMGRNLSPQCAFNVLGIPRTTANIGEVAGYLAGANVCTLARYYSTIGDAIVRSYLSTGKPVYLRIYEYKTNRALRYDICDLWIQVGNSWVAGKYEYNTGGIGCMYAH